MTHPYAIIVAAGGSSRMGQSKALLCVEGTPLVVHHIRSFSAYPTVVVVGHDAQRVRHAVQPVVCVDNVRWAETFPSDSVRLGLQAIGEATGILVTPVDVPPAEDSVVQRLVGRAASAVPVGQDGREGHPVWVTGPELARLRQGPVDGGLRALLAQTQRVCVPGCLGDDFDNQAAFDAYLRSRHRA